VLCGGVCRRASRDRARDDERKNYHRVTIESRPVNALQRNVIPSPVTQIKR